MPRVRFTRHFEAKLRYVGVESHALMNEVVHPVRTIPLASALCGFLAFALAARGQAGPDRLAPLASAIAAAERALRDGDQQVAESRYRSAVQWGWMLAAAVAVTEGRAPDADD